VTTKGTRTWLIYPLCAAAVIAALGWTTYTLLRLERAEQMASCEADRQERIRLALWRMESILAPRLAEEAARPYFHYASFYAPQRAYTRMLLPLKDREVLVPSPLLTFSDPFFKLHFQIGRNGAFTSPQAPTGNLRDLAEESYSTPEHVAEATSRLAALESDAANTIVADNVLAAFNTAERQRKVNTKLQQKAQMLLDHSSKQQAQTVQEWDTRFKSAQSFQQGEQIRQFDGKDGVRVGPFTPTWQRGKDGKWTLFLLRTVQVGKARLTQGIWTNWPAIRAAFLDAIDDLLPEATVAPTDDAAAADPGLLLTSVPAVLDPGPIEAVAAPIFTPVRGILGLSWAVVLAAIVIVGVVLRAAVDLSKRRGEFVSAVTHELRTPLTTFRMYCEMLGEGMVSGEKARGEYLATLQDESDHLSRLVENVLTYARVEQGRSTVARRDRMTVADLISQTTSRAVQRAHRAGIELSVCIDGGSEGAAASAEVVTDPSAVEQILTNLLDNAVKYACGSNPRVALSVSRAEAELHVSVSDNGPGIEPKDAESIFRPFLRGSNSDSVKQGVGLGLAISRRLARDLGGDLRLVREKDRGAIFVLSLPIAGTP